MSERISVFLSRALYIALLLLFLIAFALSINAFFNPDIHFMQLSMSYKWLALIILLLFLAGLFFVVKKTNEGEELELRETSRTNTAANQVLRKKINYKDIVFIFLIALCVRLAFLLFYGQFVYPISDFEMVHMAAMGFGRPQNYELWSHWAIYSIILQVLYILTVPHYITAQVLNAIVTSGTAVIIYLLAYNMSDKRNIALAAAAIFALYPTNIVYNTILTNEHLAVLFTCIFLLLLTIKKKSWIQLYIFSAIAGIFAAFEDSLKGIILIAVIAYVITLILAIMRSRKYLPIRESEEKKTSAETSSEIPRRSSLKLLSMIAISIAVLISTFLLSSFAIGRTAERILDIEFVDTSKLMANVLYIGLQPSGEGQVHLGDNPRMFLVLLEENNRDFELARDKTYDFLLEQIRENPGQFARLFPQKFRWAWQDDTVPAYFLWLTTSRQAPSAAINAEHISPRLLYISEQILPTVSQIFYMSLVAFTIIGLLFAFLELKERFNFGLLLISLHCFGFFLLLLISEAQSRYKVMIIPLLCILAAYGVKNTGGRIFEKSNAICCHRKGADST